MTQTPQPLEVVPKPELALWIWMRDLNLREAAELFGCSYEQVRLMCLPFADPRRRVPDTALMARIIDATGGEIGLKHFYPPELRRADPETLRLARAS
jgi:hypothetical protein